MRFGLVSVRLNMQQLAPDRRPSGASVALRAYLIPFSSTLPSVFNLSYCQAACSMWPSRVPRPSGTPRRPWPFRSGYQDESRAISKGAGFESLPRRFTVTANTCQTRLLKVQWKWTSHEDRSLDWSKMADLWSKRFHVHPHFTVFVLFGRYGGRSG